MIKRPHNGGKAAGHEVPQKRPRVDLSSSQIYFSQPFEKLKLDHADDEWVVSVGLRRLLDVMTDAKDLDKENALLKEFVQEFPTLNGDPPLQYETTIRSRTSPIIIDAKLLASKFDLPHNGTQLGGGREALWSEGRKFFDDGAFTKKKGWCLAKLKPAYKHLRKRYELLHRLIWFATRNDYIGNGQMRAIHGVCEPTDSQQQPDWATTVLCNLAQEIRRLQDPGKGCRRDKVTLIGPIIRHILKETNEQALDKGGATGGAATHLDRGQSESNRNGVTASRDNETGGDGRCGAPTHTDSEQGEVEGNAVTASRNVVEAAETWCDHARENSEVSLSSGLLLSLPPLDNDVLGDSEVLDAPATTGLQLNKATGVQGSSILDASVNGCSNRDCRRARFHLSSLSKSAEELLPACLWSNDGQIELLLAYPIFRIIAEHLDFFLNKIDGWDFCKDCGWYHKVDQVKVWKSVLESLDQLMNLIKDEATDSHRLNVDNFLTNTREDVARVYSILASIPCGITHHMSRRIGTLLNVIHILQRCQGADKTSCKTRAYCAATLKELVPYVHVAEAAETGSDLDARKNSDGSDVRPFSGIQPILPPLDNNVLRDSEVIDAPATTGLQLSKTTGVQGSSILDASVYDCSDHRSRRVRFHLSSLSKSAEELATTCTYPEYRMLRIITRHLESLRHPHSGYCLCDFCKDCGWSIKKSVLESLDQHMNHMNIDWNHNIEEDDEGEDDEDEDEDEDKDDEDEGEDEDDEDEFEDQDDEDEFEDEFWDSDVEFWGNVALAYYILALGPYDITHHMSQREGTLRNLIYVVLVRGQGENMTRRCCDRLTIHCLDTLAELAPYADLSKFPGLLTFALKTVETDYPRRDRGFSAMHLLARIIVADGCGPDPGFITSFWDVFDSKILISIHGNLPRSQHVQHLLTKRLVELQQQSKDFLLFQEMILKVTLRLYSWDVTKITSSLQGSPYLFFAQATARLVRNEYSLAMEDLETIIRGDAQSELPTVDQHPHSEDFSEEHVVSPSRIILQEADRANVLLPPVKLQAYRSLTFLKTMLGDLDGALNTIGLEEPLRLQMEKAAACRHGDSRMNGISVGHYLDYDAVLEKSVILGLQGRLIESLAALTGHTGSSKNLHIYYAHKAYIYFMMGVKRKALICIQEAVEKRLALKKEGIPGDMNWLHPQLSYLPIRYKALFHLTGLALALFGYRQGSTYSVCTADDTVTVAEHVSVELTPCLTRLSNYWLLSEVKGSPFISSTDFFRFCLKHLEIIKNKYPEVGSYLEDPKRNKVCEDPTHLCSIFADFDLASDEQLLEDIRRYKIIANKKWLDFQ